MRPVGQGVVKAEVGRVQGALRAERARVDFLGGRGKPWDDGFFYAAAASSARCTTAGSRSITVI